MNVQSTLGISLMRKWVYIANVWNELDANYWEHYVQRVPTESFLPRFSAGREREAVLADQNIQAVPAPPAAIDLPGGKRTVSLRDYNGVLIRGLEPTNVNTINGALLSTVNAVPLPTLADCWTWPKYSHRRDESTMNRLVGEFCSRILGLMESQRLPRHSALSSWARYRRTVQINFAVTVRNYRCK